ncbi:serine threonine-protein phosphatase 4 regulatory subunit 2 [Lasius niger]|uniref:Serine threonine-protein phosphatase 4 regulatory subunit 2 n=2 Tax=Lasius TaxID=488720 RepID=A0A0J7NZ69_LASNI|nr:serine threonine-protein phosphatase 4 regulatory subunit 2 [Lasius niger]
MENLEEVLQALDEFQKLRPTVIPQELEDYLCWVAKTGDPVYQWPLIKTLFREKLTRVMTDFYENCPNLEFATCPNVEHFNYDAMKSNLLERLESFANAPFTVQRICELLTAPRKEYNRVDKFMRAIEKNILVVSTREPGPIARRGETGDGMVNGSVEEDTASVTQQQPPPPPPSPSPSPSLSPSQLPSSPPSSQPPQTTTQPAQPTTQDVEMEYWEKDCTSTVTISVHTVAENEAPLLHSDVVPTADSPLTKNVFNADETAREKLEQASASSSSSSSSPRTEVATSNYISATSEFSSVSNLTSQSHEQISPNASTVPIVQNLPAVGTIINDKITGDSSVGATDIAEVIMNEDTNSQPNLDMENEEVEAATTESSTTTMTTTTTTTTTIAITTAATSTTSAATSTTTAATTTVTVVATVIPLTTDTTRNLQAAFQAKRFESDSDNKCLDSKSDEKAPQTPQSTIISVEEGGGIGHSMKSEETVLSKLNSECMDSNEMSCNESRLTESLLQTDIDMRSDTLANNTESVMNAEEIVSNKSEEESTSIIEDIDKEDLRSKSDDNTKMAISVESELEEKDSTITSYACMSAVIVSNSEALYKPEKPEIRSKEVSVMISSKESFIHDEPISQKTENTEVTDNVIEAVPRVASPNSNDNEQEAQVPEFSMDNLKVMEISNDKTALVESMVSLPISIIEKSKEATSVIEKFAPVSPTIEMTDSSDNSCRSPKDEKLTEIQDDSLTNAQDNKATVCITTKENQSSVIESVICIKEHESTELMEVDDEESLSTFQQDEPMEQETMEELSKS